MTDRTSRAGAPVSAVCAAFRTQPSAYPPEATKPDVAPPCRSAAKTKKEIKKANTHKDNNEIPLRAKEVLPGKVGGS